MRDEIAVRRDDPNVRFGQSPKRPLMATVFSHTRNELQRTEVIPANYRLE